LNISGKFMKNLVHIFYFLRSIPVSVSFQVFYVSFRNFSFELTELISHHRLFAAVTDIKWQKALFLIYSQQTDKSRASHLLGLVGDMQKTQPQKFT